MGVVFLLVLLMITNVIVLVRNYKDGDYQLAYINIFAICVCIIKLLSLFL